MTFMMVQIPNARHQNPKKLQTDNQSISGRLDGILDLGISLELGGADHRPWILELSFRLKHSPRV
jgi:hypothetical protein